MSQTAPCYVVHRTFADVDDLSVEARQWDLDLRQLDCGKFHGELLQFGTGDVHVSNARFCRSLNQKGAPPKGMRTIAVPANSDIRFLWRGQLVDGEGLLVFPRGAELASVSGPDFHVYTCSFPEELLAGVGDIYGIGELDSICGKTDAIRCGASALESVRSCLAELCRWANNGSHAWANQAVVDQLTRDLPDRLVKAIANGTGRCPPATSAKRDAAIARAEAFIELFACENISVGDICQAAGVGQRTLEYAFIERFGITPKGFLTSFRLSAVRRSLRTADPRTDKVAEIANRWGFWHMGQFAADYRKRFGELPSTTLQRCAA